MTYGSTVRQVATCQYRLTVSTGADMTIDANTGILVIINGSAKKICQIVGEEAALQLFSECGGTTMNLPLVRQDGHPTFERLAEIVGRPGAERICEQMTTTAGRFYIPTMNHALAKVRGHRIRARFRVLRKELGVLRAVSVLVDEFGVSDGAIHRTLQGMDQFSTGDSGLEEVNANVPLTIDDDLIEDMPESARYIVDLIGGSKALEVLQRVGGHTVPVPRSWPGKCTNPVVKRMADIVGEQGFSKIVHTFGGDSIYLPKMTTALIAMRDRTIRRDFDRMLATETPSEAVAVLARRHGLSDRQIWRVLKKGGVVTETKGRKPERRPGESLSERRKRAIIEYYDSQCESAPLAETVEAICKKFCISGGYAYRILAKERGIAAKEKGNEVAAPTTRAIGMGAKPKNAKRVREEKPSRDSTIRAAYERHLQKTGSADALERVCSIYGLSERQAQSALRRAGAIIKIARSRPAQRASLFPGLQSNTPAAPREGPEAKESEHDGADFGDTADRESKSLRFVSSSVTGLGWGAR